MTGTPASLARLRSAAVAFAALSACGKSFAPESNSRSLIQSMRSSATALLSGAAPCRSLLLDRGIERGSERGVAADQGFPGELEPIALALRHELHARRVDGQHVRLAVDIDLALQGLVQFGGHGSLRMRRARNSLTSAGNW